MQNKTSFLDFGEFNEYTLDVYFSMEYDVINFAIDSDSTVYVEVEKKEHNKKLYYNFTLKIKGFKLYSMGYLVGELSMDAVKYQLLLKLKSLNKPINESIEKLSSY